MNDSLFDTIQSLSTRIYDVDGLSEILWWFIDNLVEQKGFWKWPDLYFLTQEPDFIWWKHTINAIINDRFNMISYKSRKYLYKDLKRWLIRYIEINHFEW